MRQKYHFLRVEEHATGRSVLTLPGQVIGRERLSPGILVKDVKGQSSVAKAKRLAKVGDILFTTSLKRANGYYTAGDIYRLDGNDNLLYADAQEQFDKLNLL